LQQELAAKSASRDAETSKIKAQSEVVAELSEALEEWKSLSQNKPEGDRSSSWALFAKGCPSLQTLTHSFLLREYRETSLWC
jgi:hypothetical protein